MTGAGPSIGNGAKEKRITRLHEAQLTRWGREPFAPPCRLAAAPGHAGGLAGHRAADLAVRTGGGRDLGGAGATDALTVATAVAVRCPGIGRASDSTGAAVGLVGEKIRAARVHPAVVHAAGAVEVAAAALTEIPADARRALAVVGHAVVVTVARRAAVPAVVERAGQIEARGPGAVDAARRRGRPVARLGPAPRGARALAFQTGPADGRETGLAARDVARAAVVLVRGQKDALTVARRLADAAVGIGVGIGVRIDVGIGVRVDVGVEIPVRAAGGGARAAAQEPDDCERRGAQG